MLIDELVTTAPSPAHGVEIQRPASSGVWRVALELADPLAGESIVWHDLTGFYAGDRYQRGADEYMGRCKASVAQVGLRTDDDRLAPWSQDTTAVFGVNIELDAGLLMRLGMFRVVGGVTVEWQPCWTGRVETWGDAAYALGHERIHVVTVVDTSTDLVNVPTLVEEPGSDWPEWFDEVLTHAGWLFGVDTFGDPDAGLPFDDVPQPASDRLDAGCDPLGLVWRTLRSGRMVIHPAPWDTINTARYANPLLAVYPAGLRFSFSPDVGDVAYAVGDGSQEPFGITRTSLGVVNSIEATVPDDFGGTEIYAVDDPVSISKFGRKAASLELIAGRTQPVDDLLAARAYASIQALPIRTDADLDGFWPAMAMIDHLDPITVVHASRQGGPVVTAVGTVRNVTEERAQRLGHVLEWRSTVQIDVTSTETTPSLLPVESLTAAASSSWLTGGSSADVAWINPTQPDVEPTDVEYRLLERSLIWTSFDYEGVGAQSIVLNGLAANTHYTLQVRLVRVVAGVVTHVSPVTQTSFLTPALIVPTPVPYGDHTDATIPDISDEDCEIEVELQEFDGTTWTTILSFDQDDLVDNGDGTFSLAEPIDNDVFDDDKVYRFRSREVCDGEPGDWINGGTFDPPDDWTDPCTTPPAVSEAPFDDENCILYVPMVCAPDIIREYFTGIEAVKADAYGGLMVGFDDPARRALLAIADPLWSSVPHVIAYGEAPQTTGVVGSKTISAFVNVPTAAFCVFAETAAMRLTCTPTMGGWRAGATVFTPGGDASCLSGTLPLDTPARLTATYDADTGDLVLFVDGVEVNSTTFGEARNTVHALPIWRVGAGPDGWVTDVALWDGFPVGFLRDVVAHWDASQASTTTTFVEDLVGNADLIGSSMNADIQNGLGCLRAGGSGRLQTGATSPLNGYSGPFGVTIVCKLPATDQILFNHGVSTGNRPHAHTVGGNVTLDAGTILADGARDTSWHVFYFEYNGSSSKIYIDGELAASGNGGSTDPVGSAITFLDNQGGGGNAVGTMWGEAKISTGVQDAADVLGEARTLYAKWVSRYAVAAGGTVTVDTPTLVEHTFTDIGKLRLALGGNLPISYLVVAGGGAGARGGGGAGGVRTGTTTMSADLAVTVGTGGGGASMAGGTNPPAGVDGSDSTLGAITAKGGGGGGGGGSDGDGRNGGSGGGGGATSGINKAAGTGTSGQGNAGGRAGTFTGANFPSGGGGGAGGPGGDATGSSQSGVGGDGIEWPPGSGNYYAAGGGGGLVANVASTAAGGSGVGGEGRNGTTNGGNAVANTGSGGGGTGNPTTSRTAGSGSAGIVKVRYNPTAWSA